MEPNETRTSQDQPPQQNVEEVEISNEKSEIIAAEPKSSEIIVEHQQNVESKKEKNVTYQTIESTPIEKQQETNTRTSNDQQSRPSILLSGGYVGGLISLLYLALTLLAPILLALFWSLLPLLPCDESDFVCESFWVVIFIYHPLAVIILYSSIWNFGKLYLPHPTWKKQLLFTGAGVAMDIIFLVISLFLVPYQLFDVIMAISFLVALIPLLIGSFIHFRKYPPVDGILGDDEEEEEIGERKSLLVSGKAAPKPNANNKTTTTKTGVTSDEERLTRSELTMVGDHVALFRAAADSLISPLQQYYSFLVGILINFLMYYFWLVLTVFFNLDHSHVAQVFIALFFQFSQIIFRYLLHYLNRKLERNEYRRYDVPQIYFQLYFFDALAYAFYRNLYVQIDSNDVFLWMQLFHLIEDSYWMLRFWSNKTQGVDGRFPNIWLFLALPNDSPDNKNGVLLEYSLKKQAQLVSSLSLLVLAGVLRNGYNSSLFPFSAIAPIVFSEVLWFAALMFFIDFSTFGLWHLLLSNLQDNSYSLLAVCRKFYSYPWRVWSVCLLISLLSEQFLFMTILQSNNMKHNIQNSS